METKREFNRCPNCGSFNISVYYSSYTSKLHGVKRYRKCLDCNHHWGTIEVTMEEAKLFRSLRKLIQENLTEVNRND